MRLLRHACNQTRILLPFVDFSRPHNAAPLLRHEYPCCGAHEISSRMQSPDLVPVLVLLKRRPDRLASAAHEENGLQGVSQ
jgi:hypothetical protein